jgi:methionyl-tRNA formyltransferase
MANIIFMGTPDFSVPILQQLIEHHTVLGVVSQPDRPAGRKKQLKQPPVKVLALEHGLPVYQPERLRKSAAIDELEAMGRPDLYIVAAFGQILPPRVLDFPTHGSVNVHASLLPRWRGAAPIQAAIRAGDTETGVTIMKMDPGLDTGPMISKRSVPITPRTTAATLHDTLSAVGAELLIDTLPRYLSGELVPEPQDDRLATLCPQIEKSEGEIDWSQSATVIDQLVRAFTPWPGTFTAWDGRRLKVLAGQPTEGRAPIGRVVMAADGVVIGTGDGLYLPSTLQLAGGKPLSVADFVNGYPDFMGAVLGATATE